MPIPGSSVVQPDCGRGLRRGFTITEIMVGAAILTSLFAVVFELYARGNSMASKGIWRNSCINSLRVSFRQIQNAVSASSYPSQTTDTTLAEVQTDAFKLDLAASQAAATGTQGALATFDFKGKAADYEILHFWAFKPIVDGTGAFPYTKYTLKMLATGASAYAPNNRALVMDVETGTYTVSGGNTATPTCATTAVSTRTTRLVLDVDTIRVLVPTSDANNAGIFGLVIICRDPVEGKGTYSDTVLMEKNVAVHRS